MTDPRYPIGTFAVPVEITSEDRERWITEIADTPSRLREAVRGLTDAQFDTPYREGGWTVRQVVHHLPDSHLNAYTRFKLTLTEDNPTIKPYDENRWAELADVKGAAVGVSLMLLEALHRRWVILMRAMREEDWSRTFFHPEQQRALRLDRTLAMYAWHGRHHVAHITTLRERMSWH
ncbi:MAG: YfiT family bacillithiol transferase [Gemmatimonadales bacterium]